MTKDQLNNFFESTYSKAEYELLFQRAANEPELFDLVWELVKEKKPEKSWRYMWVLDHATEKSNRKLLPIIDEVYEMLMKTENESFIRHAMKLILRCPIHEDYIGALLERCIGWMNSPKAKISTQALGLEFFYKVCLLYPEMKPELEAYLDEMLDRSPSAGMKIRIRQIRELIT